MRYEQTIADVKEQWTRLASSFPELYEKAVKKDGLLTPERQKELAKMKDVKLFDYIMDRNTLDHLFIYPENASHFMKVLNDNIFSTLRALQGRKYDDKSIICIRRKLGDRAKMIALSDWGDLYTQEPREEGDVMMTGKLEYRVKEATQIPGPHFFATKTLGYQGFVKFFEEHVADVAPEGANAYLLGNTWCVSVQEGRTSSPIIAADYRDVGLEDNIYHISPIKFFNIEADKRRKYTTRTRVTKRDEEGNAIELKTDVVKRKRFGIF